MSKLLKQNLLPFSVFVTGACVLVIEIVAVRALSPHYGNTIFAVSSVISVILAALSIGYYIGGKFADKYPSLRFFYSIIMVSGVVVLGVYYISLSLLPILSSLLPITSGPLISSLILFLLPALLLGTLSPYAIKLQSLQVPEEGIGTISGKMFFWSTLGSIIGSLLTGFVLIPNLGVANIFIATGVTLFILGFLPLLFFGLDSKKILKLASIFVFVTYITISGVNNSHAVYLYSEDGVYELIQVYDSTKDDRPVRVFKQDRSASGAMFLDTDDPTDLVQKYTNYYALYKVFQPELKDVLVIGGGVYSIPKALLHELPDVSVDVSEIEPSLYDLSKRYFNLVDDPRLKTYTDDGRRMLQDSDKQYDMIFSDVYYSLFSIPSHFTTQEFFTVAKESLAEDGIFVANLIGELSRQEPSLIFAEMKTFQSVFPNSYFFAVNDPNSIDNQNIIFVGYNSDKIIDLTEAAVSENEDPFISSLASKFIDTTRYELSPYPILTDDFAPVEYLTSKVLQHTFGYQQRSLGEEILALVSQQLRYGPRYMGSDGRAKVQQFILAELNGQVEEVIDQSWDYQASDGSTQELTNIIGRINPQEKRRIILGTHYDSKRLADLGLKHKDEPVPGANDSASGVAVLLGIAKILNQAEELPEIGVDLVFFDAEEGDFSQGSDYSDWQPLGSTYFSQNLDSLYGEDKPITAIVLDMVCDKDLAIYKEKNSVKNAPDQVESFWSVAREVSEGLFKDEVGIGIRDDHTPLNKVGIPSLLVIDYDYPPFHTVNDTLDKCSAESLEVVTRAVLEYLYREGE